MITLLDLRKSLKSLKEKGRSWGQIAKELYPEEDYKKMRLLLWKIAEDGYNPKNSRTRFQLGLPLIKVVEACPHCNMVHTLEGACPQRSFVEIVIREGERPQPLKVKKIKPRDRSKPRISYKTLYLQKCAELKELQQKFIAYSNDGVGER